jgi:LacI family transcriptional regulator
VQRLVQRFVRARTLDGLLLSNSLEGDLLVPRLQEAGFPYILIGRPVEAGRNFVDITNRRASAEITRHLLAHGRSRPAMINGQEVVIPALDRRFGFEDALREAGIDPATVPVLSVEFSRPGAYAAALELLSREDRPDCIYAASDSIAIAVMNAATHLNIRIPEELGVVGFDDIMSERNERLGLTTVRQPVREMAAEAVRLLFNLISNRAEPPLESWLEPTLSIRHSCGCDWSGLVTEDAVERKEGVAAPA